MINGIEGIPGSGKSYEAVAFHVLPALEAGRLVITNLPLILPMFKAINPDYARLIEIRTRAQPVRGTWDASRIDENGNGQAFELFPPGHDFASRLDVRTKGEALQLFSEGRVYPVPASVAPFSQVWDYYSTWKHPQTGQGPLFIIDEVHVPLPRTTADSQVREWFSLHRHFNADVLLMSQRFRKIHPDISELTAILVRCRKADILGRKDSYIRKVHSGYPGAVISTEERPYKQEYFPLYKSHTQGNSVAEASASDVKPFTVKWKRIQYAWWTMTAVVCAYLFWPFGGKADEVSSGKPGAQARFQKLPPMSEDQQERVRQRIAEGLPPDVAPKVQVQPLAVPVTVQTESVDPDPFGGKKIHLTGWVQLGSKSVYTFTVSDAGRRIFDLQLAEVIATGYKFKALGHCAGVLTFRDKSTPVMCDAPALAVGSQDKPVVVTEARAPATSLEH